MKGIRIRSNMEEEILELVLARNITINSNLSSTIVGADKRYLPLVVVVQSQEQ